MTNSGHSVDSMRASALGFFGKFRQKVDAKGRLTLPAIHRRALESSQDEWLVLRRDAEGFVQIVPSLRWQEILSSRRQRDAAEKGDRGRDRKWDRRLEATDVVVAALDLKGRITVPKELLAHGGISKDAMVMGVGGHLELWDPDRYREAAQGRSVDPGAIDDLLYG